MNETKTCEVCGNIFGRQKDRLPRWYARRFCSIACYRCVLITDPAVRFFSFFKADPVTECWNWTGGKSKSTGYAKYRGESAHRFSFETFIGHIPAHLWVLHRCDNRVCVNPHHFFLGTVQDNVDDMFSKDRANKARGEDVGGSRFTEEQVISILNDPRTITQIAKQYDVCWGTIQAIKQRRTWAHVDPFMTAIRQQPEKRT